MQFLSALLLGMAAQTQVPDIPDGLLRSKPAGSTVLARVSGVPVTAAEVEALSWDWRSYEALLDLVTLRMLQVEARKVGAGVTQAEIDAEVARQLKGIEESLPPGSDLEKNLLVQGFPKSRIYLRARTQLLLDAIAMRSFNSSDFVEVSTILVKPKSELASDVAEAIKLAETAYQEIKGGGSWDGVLRRFHSDPKVLESHGLVGWRQLSIFPESLRASVPKMKPGEVTQPTQTPNGIQIFRIERHGSAAAGKELDDLRGQYLLGSRESVFARISKEAKVEHLYFKP
jgi:hypothetical protein